MRNAIFAALLLPVVAAAQSLPSVEYDVTFDNAAHHEARITVTWRDVGADVLELRMSRSSPGRYAIHEFAKNVYNVWIVDGEGNPLDATRPDPYQWNVAGHDGTVSATYTLYADRADGTYSGIDRTHAHLNMPATFLWARGTEKRPITVTFSPSNEEWRVATQLVATGDPFVFTAPDLQYFLDSPTELSDFSLRTWQVESGGRTQTLQLAVHHEGTDADVDDLFAMAQKVVAEQAGIFGELPAFDYGTYTFIADYLPHAFGDGMEHRNSTILTSNQSLYDASFGQLGTLSHEFVHAWNVERIRPAELEPFDFERANMTGSLWFAEGFTSYYGPLAIHRAGESSIAEFSGTAASWINTVSNSPGRMFASPIGMSRQAPFVDAATAIDETNFANTFISYYTYGAAIALALDLSIRQRFEGKSLDAVMRHMWQVHGKSEKPYRLADVRAAIAAATGNERFAQDFFARFVEDSELPDFAGLLESAGFELRKAHPGGPWTGPLSLQFHGGDAIIAGNTIIGTPLYNAGIDRGDRIVSLGRSAIISQSSWDDAVSRHQPGDTETIRFVQRGIERTAELTFDEDPTLEVVTFEAAGRTLDPAASAFREAWLGSAAN